MIPLVLLLASKLLADVPPPRISVESWLLNGDIAWNEYKDEPQPYVKIVGKTLSAPGNVDGVRLACSAPYPIEWVFDDNCEFYARRGAHTFNQFITHVRNADDMFDKSTYEYVSILLLFGEDSAMTSNYTCQSVEDTSVLKWVYVFWEGSSPPYLLEYGEKSTVYTGVEGNQTNTENEMINVILPCRVSVKTVNVLLQKRQNGTYRNLLSTEHATYNPHVGFTLETNRRNITGRYLCVVPDSPTYDNQTVFVKNGHAPTPEVFREYINGNASFGYDPTKRMFTCCSDNWQPPALQIIYCDHPTICNSKKHLLDEVVNNGQRHVGRSCTSVTIVYQTSGVLKCVGSGINVFREYFFPLSVGLSGVLYKSKNVTLNQVAQGSPYYHWEDVNPVEMISIQAPKEMSVLYAGQTIRLVCHPSQYYFAEGAKWGFTWNNHSRLITNGTYAQGHFALTKRMLYPKFITLKMTVDANLTTISCFAPVWNSSVYVEKSIPIQVNIPKTPSIDSRFDNFTVPDIFWHINETKKVLTCVIDGLPVPKIYWYHNGQLMNETLVFQGTSTLVFNKVDFQTHGEFVCRAVNVAGAVTKTFHVNIKVDTSNKGWIVGIVLLTLLSLITMAVVGFLLKRVRNQTKSIDHLRTVAFKDVLDQQHGFSFTNSENTLEGISTIDASKASENTNEILASFSAQNGASYHKF